MGQRQILWNFTFVSSRNMAELFFFFVELFARLVKNHSLFITIWFLSVDDHFIYFFLTCFFLSVPHV